jgi:hypothetical protein
MHPDEILSRASLFLSYNSRSAYCQTFFFTSRPASFDLVIFVELVFRWIKIGLAFSRLVDQKGIGENTGYPRRRIRRKFQPYPGDSSSIQRDITVPEQKP